MPRWCSVLQDLKPAPNPISCEFRSYLSQHAHLLLKAPNRDPTEQIPSYSREPIPTLRDEEILHRGVLEVARVPTGVIPIQ